LSARRRGAQQTQGDGAPAQPGLALAASRRPGRAAAPNRPRAEPFSEPPPPCQVMARGGGARVSEAGEWGAVAGEIARDPGLADLVALAYDAFLGPLETAMPLQARGRRGGRGARGGRPPGGLGRAGPGRRAAEGATGAPRRFSGSRIGGRLHA
jgi:hypothetical protein